jgi:CRISPR/Cas system CMR subunit Cmr6 (Cas7 group RAMP superfamily)
VKASKDEVPIDDNTSEVTPSVDNLVAELDKMLKRAARERKEFINKLEITLKELKEAKKHAVAVSDEVECDNCAIHMSSLTSLQSKYASLLDQNDELKSRSILLVACKSYSSL